MNTILWRRLGPLFTLFCATLLFCAAAGETRAQEPAAVSPHTPAAMAAPAPMAAPDKSHDDDFDEPDTDTVDKERDSSDHVGGHRRHWRDYHGNDVVSIGHDSELSAGQRAHSVVSVMGSSKSDGEAFDVISILGDTRVSGPVSHDAVAVLGNTYVDSKVGNALAVFGNVRLGPHAEVEGDVISVFGSVYRDPAAIIHGGVQNIVSANFDDVAWLHTWIHECLFYGRPLALAAGLGWAWSLALGYLALYIALALLFRSAIGRCVQTVENEPGHTALAALVTILLTPVAIVLLCVTLIGIAAIPFVVAALLCAGLFGKAVMLAWTGQRVMGQRLGAGAQPAVAVAVGGVLVLALYAVPVLGLLVYPLLGFFGFGAVIYTLISSVRARQNQKAERLKPAPAAAAAATAATAATASMENGPGLENTPDMASAEAAAAANPAAGEASAPGTVPGMEPGAAPGTASGTAPGAAPGASRTDAPSAAGPAPFVSAGMPRAGFWIRMGALLLDVVLVGVVLRLSHPLGHFHLVVLAAYGALMWKLRGATVGGMVFDLHVVRLDGRPVDWETSIVRALGCFLSLAVVGLGFIWIAFDDANQAWHDKIAGTVVVRVPKA
jgi:uncharacterized RDD family membrane protein YckC